MIRGISLFTIFTNIHPVAVYMSGWFRLLSAACGHETPEAPSNVECNKSRPFLFLADVLARSVPTGRGFTAFRCRRRCESTRKLGARHPALVKRKERKRRISQEQGTFTENGIARRLAWRKKGGWNLCRRDSSRAPASYREPLRRAW